MNKLIGCGWRIFLLVALFVVLGSPVVVGFGLLPASQSVLLGSDSGEFSIFILNDGHDKELDVSIEGSLADFVEVDKSRIVLSPSGDREEIKVKIGDVPDSIVPGEHVVRIIVSDVSSGSGQISARISLSFRLTITVPHDNAFLDVSLFAPNFDKTKGGNFVIQAQNKGSSNAVNVVPVVDIYSSTNHGVATLRGDSKLVRGGETVNFALPLSEDLENGVYSARASLVYSGESTSVQRTFSVGSPEILVDDISTSEFRLGGIAGFDIFLKNNWGEELSVFANIEFRKQGEVLEEFTSATTNIGSMSLSRINAYWKTNSLSAGTYEMLIKLNYLDKEDVSSHEVLLEADKVSIIGTGRAITPSDERDILPLLIFAILVLVLINSFFVYKFMVKKKDEK